MLKEFLSSNWTPDEALRQQAAAAYFGSIGGWKETVDDMGVVYAYYAYRDRRLHEMGEQFLRQLGIEPTWR